MIINLVMSIAPDSIIIMYNQDKLDSLLNSISPNYQITPNGTKKTLLSYLFISPEKQIIYQTIMQHDNLLAPLTLKSTFEHSDANTVVDKIYVISNGIISQVRINSV